MTLVTSTEAFNNVATAAQSGNRGIIGQCSRVTTGSAAWPPAMLWRWPAFGTAPNRQCLAWSSAAVLPTSADYCDLAPSGALSREPARRICCCAASDDDASTACPLSAEDCDDGVTSYDAATRRCLSITPHVAGRLARVIAKDVDDAARYVDSNACGVGHRSRYYYRYYISCESFSQF